MKNTIIYEYQGKTYINLTNCCTNSCNFCIRNTNDGVADYYLWLDKEPTAAEVIAALNKTELCDEVVFCGFGEPLCAFEVLVEVAKYLKEQGKRVRINTNGQASLIVGEGAAEKLAGLIDIVNISLNASTAAEYNRICNCTFGEEGFDALIAFAAECKKYIPRVIFSVVDVIGEEEIAACKAVADSVGVEFRVRSFIA